MYLLSESNLQFNLTNQEEIFVNSKINNYELKGKVNSNLKKRYLKHNVEWLILKLECLNKMQKIFVSNTCLYSPAKQVTGYVRNLKKV